jgi:hypothetical protein
VTAAAQQLRALVGLLGPEIVLTGWSVTRTLAEHCSRVAWLLSPDATPIGRVARFYMERVVSVHVARMAAEKIGERASARDSPEPAFAGSNLLWQATIRLLTSLNPPEQGWDRVRNSYMTIAEPGTFAVRVGELERLVDDNELGESVLGKHSHYAHRKHLAGHTIEGKAARALCGVFFVPTQDHDGLGAGSICEQRYAEMPG